MHAGAAYIFEPAPEPDPIAPNIVLTPWPYVYIYTGDGITYKDTPIRIGLIVGEGTQLTFTISTPPKNGDVELEQEITYFPKTGFTILDEFQLEVTDRGEVKIKC